MKPPLPISTAISVPSAVPGSAQRRIRKMLPKDPVILLSYVNTKLRDDYASLQEFCGAEDADPSVLKNMLSAIGYQYDEKTNRFK